MYDPDDIFPLVARPASAAGVPIALIFDQPSTRTDMSFRLACHAIGAIPDPKPMGMSSMAKGETLTHTFQALADMGYAAIVYRGYGTYEEPGIPVINAGNKGEHPTQALIDLYTAERALGETGGIRVRLEGDTSSRVAQSVTDLFRRRGHRVMIDYQCDPPMEDPDRRNFDILMVFRWQDGRPAERPITRIPPGVRLMAPGPVIDEIDHGLIGHPRSLIREQVGNAVKIRAAVILWELERARRLRSLSLADAGMAHRSAGAAAREVVAV